MLRILCENIEILYRECREGFGEVSSTNCLKKISSKQKCLILQNRFWIDNTYAFPKAILHIIPHQIDETLKERQMKCPKIV